MTPQTASTPFLFRPNISLDEYQQLWKKELHLFIETSEALKRPRVDADISGYLDELNAFEIMGRSEVRGHVWKTYHPDPAFRKEGEEAERAFASQAAQLQTSSEISNNLSRYEAADLPANPDSQRFLREWKKTMKKGGAFLNENAKVAVQDLTVAIQDEITKFINNIRDDDRFLEFRPQALTGLPEDFLSTHPCDPETGMIRITSKFADTRPVMEFCLSQDTRKAVFHMIQRRASPQNEAVLKRLLDLRQQKATLLGYSSWAEYQLEETMVKTSEAALQFLQTAFEAIELQAHEEKAEIAQILESKGHGELNPWDLSFGLTLLKKERLQGFDVKATRQYFPVHRVFPALQHIAQDLFSLRFEPSVETDAWHPAVTSCLVYDKASGSERLIGRLFFDIYTREGKMDGACCTTVRAPIPEVQLAEVILNANMPDQENACISYLEAKTILHELGHCVHALLARQRYAKFAGISCEMDFVEAPSQMLELWLTNKDLFAFAINEKGERIPDRLLDQLISSQEIGRATSERSSIFLSKFALDLHISALPEGTATSEVVSKAADLYGNFPLCLDTTMHHSIGHLAASNYASRYYCYIFSQVICVDMFAEFSKNGDLSNKEVALRYRREILEKGGSEDAEDMVVGFMGRTYSIDAFKAWLTSSLRR